MESLKEFKTGDTFSLVCTYKQEGSPVELPVDAEIRAQIRTRTKELVSDTTVTILDQSSNVGKFTVNAFPADTSDWVTGKHFMDIEVTIDDIIRSTETFLVPVIEDITK